MDMFQGIGIFYPKIMRFFFIDSMTKFLYPGFVLGVKLLLIDGIAFQLVEP
jgi:hypothetical protein